MFSIWMTTRMRHLQDIIQSRLSRLPVSSLELFSILDDASERTFLCAGSAESMQKYVFDGEAGKIGQEMKNLIACTSFLIEQKLVRLFWNIIWWFGFITSLIMCTPQLLLAHPCILYCCLHLYVYLSSAHTHTHWDLIDLVSIAHSNRGVVACKCTFFCFNVIWAHV